MTATIQYFGPQVMQYVGPAESLQTRSARFVIPGDDGRVFNCDMNILLNSEKTTEFDPDQLRAYYLIEGTVQQIETDPAPGAKPGTPPRIAYPIIPNSLKRLRTLDELKAHGVVVKEVKLSDLPRNSRRQGRTTLGAITFAEAKLQFPNQPDYKIAQFVRSTRAKYEADTGTPLPPDPQLEEYLRSLTISSNREMPKATQTMQL